MNKEKLIDSLQGDLVKECSDIERLTFTNAIELLNNEVNPDKVKNWVNQTLSTFNNKPKPMSEKEKAKREERKRRKAEKLAKYNSLNEEMKTLLENYDVLMIGFFDTREISNSEYDLLETLIRKKDLYWKDIGDGAFEPFLSKKKLDGDFFKQYNRLHSELTELAPNNDWEKTILSEYLTWNVSVFRKKITELV